MKCLIVRPPFAKYIVDGVKTSEYRSRKTNIRGRIGIIEAGTSTVIGDVELGDCVYDCNYRIWEWELYNCRRYLIPIKYQHEQGVVVWTNVEYNLDEVSIAPRLSCEVFVSDKIKCFEIEKEFFKNYLR